MGEALLFEHLVHLRGNGRVGALENHPGLARKNIVFLADINDLVVRGRNVEAADGIAVNGLFPLQLGQRGVWTDLHLGISEADWTAVNLDGTHVSLLLLL